MYPMTKREIREKERKDKVKAANCKLAKDAITDLLLIYEVAGDCQFYVEDKSFSKNEFYVNVKGGRCQCVIVASEYDFQFLGINDEVTKRMHNKFNLYQNWRFFKLNDIEGLQNMFIKCVLEN